jgi:hypothetical protein
LPQFNWHLFSHKKCVSQPNIVIPDLLCPGLKAISFLLFIKLVKKI